ncbi:MAG: hypothetical protein V4506_01275 [Bacteroidota bacterium]
MDISIKKPCHENWEDMTPNQQGAFCGKCVKTVIDFSTKSLEEIKDFFSGNQEQKVCGRFEEDQLTALSFDAFFSRFKRFEFTKRFAVILYFTFGMWLFGVSNASAQTPAQTKGEVKVKPIMGGVKMAHPKDTTKKVNSQPLTKMGTVARVQPKDTTKQCVKPKPKSNMKMGKVAPVKPKPEKSTKIMGDVAAPPPEEKK